MGASDTFKEVNKLQMDCNFVFRDVAKGYLARGRVVLFESHTNTARSSVLVSAS